MRCPDCHFLNSDTRNRCLRCKTPLLGISPEASKDEDGETEISESTATNSRPKKISYPKRKSRKTEDSTLAALHERLQHLSQNGSLEGHSNILSRQLSSTQTQQDFTTNELIPSGQILKTDFFSKQKKRRRQLELLRLKWRNKLNPQIATDFEKLMLEFNDHDLEFAINPMTEIAKAHSVEISELFELQLNELSTDVHHSVKSTNYLKSDSRSIDRRTLNVAFDSLKPSIIESIEKESEEADEFSEFTPVPGNKLIILASIIDLITHSALAVYFFSVFMKLNSLEQVIFELSKIYNSDSIFKFATIFFLTWVTLDFIMLFFFSGSLGQRLLGLKVSNLQGKKPTKKQLLKRFTSRFFTAITLGLKAIPALRRKNCMKCDLSNTRLAYAAFVND